MDKNSNYEEEIAFIQDHLPSWKNLKSHEITFEKLPYANSRVVYKVSSSVEYANPKKVILRELKTWSIEWQQNEQYAFEALSSVGIGPKYYGENSKYRLEEYLESRNIKPSEINKKNIRRKLALQLGVFHSLKLDKLKKTQTLIEKILDDQNFINKFFSQCDTQLYTPDEMKIITEIKALGAPSQIDFIKQIIQKYPHILSHNDIWVGNILIMKNDVDIRLIDYEMVDYNFAGYDIAKILLEPAFDRFKPDSPYHELCEERLPSEEDAKDFIRYYVVGNKIGLFEKDEENRLIDDTNTLLLTYEMSLFSSKTNHQIILDDLYNQVKDGLLVATYFSTLIGINVGREFSKEKNFLQYALDSYKLYKRFKSQIMKGLFPFLSYSSSFSSLQ